MNTTGGVALQKTAAFPGTNHARHAEHGPHERFGRLNFYENVLYVKPLATNRASIRTLMSALALGAVWVSVRCGAAI